MLGLGDIVIPGILVALMLRLDEHIKPGSKEHEFLVFLFISVVDWPYPRLNPHNNLILTQFLI